MTYRRPVLAIICLAVLGMGVAAYYLGPPGVSPVPQPGAQLPVAAPAVGATALTSGTVRSFGPVPQCGDQTATASVLGLLRDKLKDRTLGLANIHVAGHSQIGDLVQWDCDAAVQTGDGERRIHYQISQLTAGRETWEITLSAPPARSR